MVVIKKSQRERYRWFVDDEQGVTVAMSPTSYDTEGETQVAFDLAYRLMRPKGFWARIRALWSRKPGG